MKDLSCLFSNIRPNYLVTSQPCSRFPRGGKGAKGISELIEIREKDLSTLFNPIKWCLLKTRTSSFWSPNVAHTAEVVKSIHVSLC